jgi:hypothetical protein
MPMPSDKNAGTLTDHRPPTTNHRPRTQTPIARCFSGGHRASANAIRDAFDEVYPDTFECEIVDIWTDHAVWPFTQFVPAYKVLVCTWCASARVCLACVGVYLYTRTRARMVVCADVTLSFHLSTYLPLYLSTSRLRYPLRRWRRIRSCGGFSGYMANSQSVVGSRRCRPASHALANSRGTQTT